MTTPLAAGVLLTAQPELVEPEFMRAVMYLLEHHEGGSMGVILNRPLALELDSVWDACPSALRGAAMCASGGPVEPQRGVLVHHYPGVADAYEVGRQLYIGGDPAWAGD